MIFAVLDELPEVGGMDVLGEIPNDAGAEGAAALSALWCTDSAHSGRWSGCMVTSRGGGGSGGLKR